MERRIAAVSSMAEFIWKVMRETTLDMRHCACCRRAASTRLAGDQPAQRADGRQLADQAASAAI